jgi:Carboxypeptidase regulatory-like domain
VIPELFGASSPLRQRLSALSPALSGVQTVVGLTTGLLSIGGVLLAIPGFFSTPPPAPTMGQIVAIVEEAKTEKAITDAKVEILTPQNALITTVTPNYFGKARHSLEEGLYRIRVSHPRYAAEVRQVQVVRGQTAEVHLRLRAGSSSPLAQAERVVREGVGAVRRIFGQ